MTQITQEEFNRRYPPLKSKDLTQDQISLALGISRATLCRKLKHLDDDTEMKQSVTETTQEIQNVLEQTALDEGDKRAETIIDTAYKTNMKAIKQAVDKKDWDKAASLSLFALRIASTIHEKERVVQALQIKIDARRQTVFVLGDLTPENRESLNREAIREAFRMLRTGGVCPMCGQSCGDVIDVSPEEEVE